MLKCLFLGWVFGCYENDSESGARTVDGGRCNLEYRYALDVVGIKDLALPQPHR